MNIRGKKTFLIRSSGCPEATVEFEYQGRLSTVDRIFLFLEYEKEQLVEYEVRLPKGQFTAGQNVAEKTFDVSGDEPEVIVDLTLPL